MSASVTQKTLDQAWTDYGKTYGGAKNDYFAPLYLTDKFGGDIDAHAHKVAFGGNDYGCGSSGADVDGSNSDHWTRVRWGRRGSSGGRGEGRAPSA